MHHVVLKRALRHENMEDIKNINSYDNTKINNTNDKQTNTQIRALLQSSTTHFISVTSVICTKLTRNEMNEHCQIKTLCQSIEPTYELKLQPSSCSARELCCMSFPISLFLIKQKQNVMVLKYIKLWSMST